MKFEHFKVKSEYYYSIIIALINILSSNKNSQKLYKNSKILNLPII
jgi:hypothetical protein